MRKKISLSRVIHYIGVRHLILILCTIAVFIAAMCYIWHYVSMLDPDTAGLHRSLDIVIILTLVLVIAAAALTLLAFYRLSKRELSNQDLHIQIRAAADIYDTIVDINLQDDTFYEINNKVDEQFSDRYGSIQSAEDMGLLFTDAQKLLVENVDVFVEESSRPYMKEFLNFSTLNERLAKKNTLIIEFLNDENKWCRGRIMCAERLPDGTVVRVLWGVEVIDDEKRERDYLRHLSETDLMTGISNRTSGEGRVRDLLEQGHGGMFVLFDIDQFKHFNDNFGHTTGDQVIIAVANCLKNAFRSEDIVMRLGGDEFAAFASAVCTSDVGNMILERFYDNLDNVVLEGHETVKINVSAGVSFCQAGENTTFHALYESADQCMYESKKTTDSRITYQDRERPDP